MQFLEEQQRIRSSLLIERDTIKKELRNYPEGKLMLERRLASKGADRETSRQVLDEIYTDEYTKGLVNQARAAIGKKGKAQSEEEVRFCLKKLGFTDRDIKLSE